MKKKILLYMLCTTLSTTVFSTVTLPLSQIVSYAHSGRTDSSGGHRDNKNKSGLGSYHYHCGGNPPHLHTDGVCPYGGGNSGGQGQAAKTTAPAANQNTDTTRETQPAQQKYGWKQNGYGWYYQTGENTYCQNGLANIDGKVYCFNQAGTMVTGWQSTNNEWCYFCADGSMVTGWQYIDLKWYYFDSNGTMLKDWQTIGDKRYYFYADGHMATGSADIDGTSYYFNTDGSLNENWDDDYDSEDYDDWFD